MIKLKIKNVKPIEIDAHFKYRCPKCGWDHWISLKEAKTKNFKIVCDCNTSFKPKQIKNISIEYCIKNKSSKLTPTSQDSIQSNITSINNTQSETKIEVVEKPVIRNLLDKEILDKCSKLLISYGFTSNEAKTLINQAYEKTNSDNVGLLVKNALELIGDK